MPLLTGTPAAGRSAGSVTGLTVAFTSTTDPLWVVIAVFVAGGDNPGTCTFNGVPLSLVAGGLTVASSNYTFHVFRLAAPGAVSANIVYTNSGAPDSHFLGLVATNASGAQAAVRVNNSRGSSTTASTAISSAVATDLLLHVVASDNANQTFTPTAPATAWVTTTDATTNIHLCLSQRNSPGSDVTMQQTLGSSDTWSSLALALLEADTGGGGGGGGAPPTLGRTWT